MSNSSEVPSHLLGFDFEPYNTTRFWELDLVQQWNECCSLINELTVKILELEIYDGAEKDSYDYHKYVWKLTQEQWWHRRVSHQIQKELQAFEKMYASSYDFVRAMHF